MPARGRQGSLLELGRPGKPAPTCRASRSPLHPHPALAQGAIFTFRTVTATPRGQKYSPDGKLLIVVGASPAANPGSSNLVHNICTDGRRLGLRRRIAKNHRFQVFRPATAKIRGAAGTSARPCRHVHGISCTTRSCFNGRAGPGAVGQSRCRQSRGRGSASSNHKGNLLSPLPATGTPAPRRRSLAAWHGGRLARRSLCRRGVRGRSGWAAIYPTRRGPITSVVAEMTSGCADFHRPCEKTAAKALTRPLRACIN